jgi:hypothetical protein
MGSGSNFKRRHWLAGGESRLDAARSFEILGMPPACRVEADDDG